MAREDHYDLHNIFWTDEMIAKEHEKRRLNKVPKESNMTLDETNDFGFTIEKSAVLVVNDKRAEELRDMIMPLLNNLKKNPEAEIIRWPNRVEKIDEFIAKMNKLVDGE